MERGCAARHPITTDDRSIVNLPSLECTCPAEVSSLPERVPLHRNFRRQFPTIEPLLSFNKLLRNYKTPVSLSFSPIFLYYPLLLYALS